jgi:hypothetical protein
MPSVGLLLLIMKIWFLLITSIVANAPCTQQLSGSVKSSSGQPLANVYIFPDRVHIAETDDQGNFFVSRFERIIAFRRAGSRPLTKIVDPSITKLDVVLDDAAAGQWALPLCTKGDKRKRVGFTVRMLAPKDAIARQGSDVDYQNFAIGYGPKSKRVWLSGVSVPYGSLGIPPYAWILNATEFSERSYKAGDDEGADMRGRLQNGTYWRYVGRLGIGRIQRP